MPVDSIQKIVSERLSERAVFLAASYQLTQGRTSEFVSTRDISSLSGIDNENIVSIVFYLKEKGLVQHVGSDGQRGMQFMMCAAAVDLIEKIEATGYGPPVDNANSTNIEGSSNNVVVIQTRGDVESHLVPPPRKWWEGLPETVRKAVAVILGS